MPSQYTVKVTEIKSIRGGGAIFKGRADDNTPITVIAPYNLVDGSRIELEDLWNVVGDVSMHPIYGRQLNAIDLDIELPSHDLIVDYLLNSPKFRNFGLGKNKIEVLWKNFKEELIDILDHRDVDTLSSIDGITKRLASGLVARWEENAKEVRVRKWLKKNNIKRSIARKAIKIYKDNVIAHLERDPYELTRFLSWKKVDNVAASLGISRNDARRLAGAVENTLFWRLDNADTLVPHKTMKRKVGELLGFKGNDIIDLAIDKAKEASIVTGDEFQGYQHKGIARLERRITKRLQNMLAGEIGQQLSLFSDQIDDRTIEDGIHNVEALISSEVGRSASLAPEQRNAIQLAVKEPFSIICGGAGTGKTTILRAVHEILSPIGIPIHQMALAGRAAQRMRESTGRPASTIAKFCIEVKNGQRPVAEDSLLIVDESSMVDLSSMYRMLSYVPVGARVVMVGDPHQLPPVSFGLVFHKLVESSIIPMVELNEIHRQDEASGIPSVARDIRAHIVPEGIQRHKEIPSNLDDLTGVHFIDCPDCSLKSQGLLNAKQVAWRIYENLGMDPDEIRVIGAIKNAAYSGWGVYDINELIRRELNQAHNFIGTDLWRFAVGEEIMFTLNDYDIGLNNGCLGTILELIERPVGWEMIAEWDDGEVRHISEDKFRHVKSAYAMTVHKAQGSQFKKIICPIFRTRILDNSLIYTALTRGEEQVVFFGDWKVFENAVISKKSSDNRCVGFSMQTYNMN